DQAGLRLALGDLAGLHLGRLRLAAVAAEEGLLPVDQHAAREAAAVVPQLGAALELRAALGEREARGAVLHLALEAELLAPAVLAGGLGAALLERQRRLQVAGGQHPAAREVGVVAAGRGRLAGGLRGRGDEQEQRQHPQAEPPRAAQRRARTRR